MAEILARFNQIFGIPGELKEERYRFVQRINQTAFHRIEQFGPTYEDHYKRICYFLGVNSHDEIAKLNAYNYGRPVSPP